MSDNSVVKNMKYDSFGNILEDSAPNFELPFRFAGGIWDEDTKLVRFGVRDYDSETGRWTSKEPLGFAGAKNFYIYAENNGIEKIDLDGLKTTVFIIADGAYPAHAALYIEHEGGGSYLYDPNGGWNGLDEYGGPARGEGDYFTNPDINSYYEYHGGLNNFTRYSFDTGPEVELEIIKSVEDFEDNDPGYDFDCSRSVSSVLSGIGPFRYLKKDILFSRVLGFRVKQALTPPSTTPLRVPTQTNSYTPYTIPSMYLQK